MKDKQYFLIQMVRFQESYKVALRVGVNKKLREELLK